ncbi:hypothetical protein FS842_008773 [Serendipita sp. 407]|nr:hypothetical protein FS842_008773 [Serendipita sp. 407]
MNNLHLQANQGNSLCLPSALASIPSLSLLTKPLTDDGLSKTTDGTQNVHNPMVNGNGVPAAPANTTTTNLPLPPPPPPPQPEPESEPEASLVVDWNSPGGSFSGYSPDEHFSFV